MAQLLAAEKKQPRKNQACEKKKVQCSSTNYCVYVYKIVIEGELNLEYIYKQCIKKIDGSRRGGAVCTVQTTLSLVTCPPPRLV